MYDCTNYDSDNCPKEKKVKRVLKKFHYLNTLLVGCWGVYCWYGYVQNKKYAVKKEVVDDEKLFEIFNNSTELYGQKTVVRGMKQISKKIKPSALFLAGDNVYSYNIPKKRY
jgi:hypothetical protein